MDAEEYFKETFCCRASVKKRRTGIKKAGKIPSAHRRKTFSNLKKAKKHPEKAKKDIYNDNLAGNKAKKGLDKAKKGIYKAAKHPQNVILALFNVILAFWGCNLAF
jgi:hypothetical protein